ncbi:MAG: type II toxin-antitoxin system HicB family antitoxin [Eubacterium sp.]|nr:type II toxin-antitoxin system HicB family antitoxin [Eubacterium sp.]
MKFYYPVIIKKESETRYHAVFPDLEQCEASGNSLEDVLDHSVEAARCWIEAELEEEEPDLPPATDPADISVSSDEIVRNILVNYRFTEGWEE